MWLGLPVLRPARLNDLQRMFKGGVMLTGGYSKTGVYLFDDFRDNLIIDRCDPIFNHMRQQKN